MKVDFVQRDEDNEAKDDEKAPCFLKSTLLNNFFCRAIYYHYEKV